MGARCVRAQQRSLGGENDAPGRNISRFLDGLADRLKIGLDVRQIWRNDRFGRGGDHTELLNAGYPAVRFTVAVENYDWQHQDVRTEKGKHYGDTVDHMDFPYLAKVAKLNIAALAAMASAPPPPEPKVEGAVSTDTTITFPIVFADRYLVRWRRTDANQWEHSHWVVRSSETDPVTTRSCWMDSLILTGARPTCTVLLPHIRVDDWVFGVSSVSKDGFESPVASAVPGGAFHPYIAPDQK